MTYMEFLPKNVDQIYLDHDKLITLKYIYDMGL